MRKLAFYLSIGALAALLSGCLVGEGPDFRQSGADLVTMEAEELPAGLDTCSVYYAQDSRWEIPDAMYGVKGKPGVVVFMQDGLSMCQTTQELALTKLPEADFGALSLTEGGSSGQVMNLLDDSNPLPAEPPNGGQDGVKNPIGDSNPLPAKPGADDNLSRDDGPEGDSNPLPASPGPNTTASLDLVNGDSNPLPARGDSRSVDQQGADDQ